MSSAYQDTRLFRYHAAYFDISSLASRNSLLLILVEVPTLCASYMQQGTCCRTPHPEGYRLPRTRIIYLWSIRYRITCVDKVPITPISHMGLTAKPECPICHATQGLGSKQFQLRSTACAHCTKVVHRARLVLLSYMTSRNTCFLSAQVRPSTAQQPNSAAMSSMKARNDMQERQMLVRTESR
jgi:hypothetical protein